MHAPGVSRSSPNRAVIRRLWCLQTFLSGGGYGEIDNEIDNLDNLESFPKAEKQALGRLPRQSTLQARNTHRQLTPQLSKAQTVLA